MIKPDIIVSWPRNCDYPLWRQYIHAHRAQFNEIIVVFTETHQGEDYREFLRKAMFHDHVLCLDSPEVKSGEDWRNVAVHAGLLHSYNAAWIFFTEQDLEIKGDFWEYVDQKINENNFEAMVVIDDVRIHPCGILIRRDALNRTQKQFGIVPDKLDHFGLIQKDLENPENHIKWGVIPEPFYYHMNGLSHNMALVASGQKPNWRQDEFGRYLADCMASKAVLDDRFKKLATNYLREFWD